MTDPSTPTAPVGTLLRISVTAGDRRIDLGAPGNVAVVEIVPGLARALGVLDAASVYGGYRLVTAEGESLDPARSLIASGVEDGAVLALESGAEQPEPRVYDDVVEAVADAVEARFRPWTPHDSALGAAWGAAAIVAATSLLLLTAERSSQLAPVVAALAALLAVAAGTVVARTGRDASAGRVLVLAAGLPAAVAGLTVGTQSPSWGWPAALAGAGLVVAGLLAVVALPSGRETAIAPIGLGLALGVVGATVELTGTAAQDVLAVVVAVVLTASIGVPWLALASTPLRVVSPRTDAEILLDPAPVDPDRVRRQLDAGYRIQLALRVAVGVLALVATPALVASGLLGTTLLVVGWVGLLLATRQSYARADVLVVVCLGVTGLALTLVVAALVHPSWRTALVCAAAVGVAALVALGLVAPRRRVALARVGDTVEMTCLAVLLPLGVAAAGMV
ncbi:type VII secretion integral membrane protein EccD [Cellulomonas palmilytica]|uniref:type VII secretion integral membrane protein EccD n=1 Tax=Cellulomonas palmilytica TaxID=2608402 RepID=UPI001F41872B|nr:type VII secretion integral membrane protein EccD [Cellulomonas palmilytica]UJP39872.1 type VII secretion integral membrane protein EccD [Cellulomonas palmilytica]